MRAILLTAVVLISCAHVPNPTPYQRHDGGVGGYDERRMRDNHWKVTFAANGMTPKAVARDYLLLRCAELALMDGRQFFRIVESRDLSQRSSYTTPASSVTTGGVNAWGGVSATTVTTGGGSYNIEQPGLVVLIQTFAEEPPPSLDVYDAVVLRKKVSKHYALEDSELESTKKVTLVEDTP